MSDVNSGRSDAALTYRGSGIYAVRDIDSDRRYIGASKNIANFIRGLRTQLRAGRYGNAALQEVWNRRQPDDPFAYEVLEQVDDVSLLGERRAFWLERFSAGMVYNARGVEGTRSGWTSITRAAQDKIDAKVLDRDLLHDWAFQEIYYEWEAAGRGKAFSHPDRDTRLERDRQIKERMDALILERLQGHTD